MTLEVELEKIEERARDDGAEDEAATALYDALEGDDDAHGGAAGGGGLAAGERGRRRVLLGGGGFGAGGWGHLGKSRGVMGTIIVPRRPLKLSNVFGFSGRRSLSH